MNSKGGRSATVARWAHRVEDILRAHPDGLTREQISGLACIGKSTTHKALSEGRRNERCLAVKISESITKWWHWDYRDKPEAIQKAMRIAYNKRAAERDRQKRLEKKAEESDGKNKEDICIFELPFVHRILPADSALQLKPKGPNSVWQLAA